MVSHGELVADFFEGSVAIFVRHSCIRRDLYELKATAPLDEHVVQRLRERGQVQADGAALVIVDVPGVHRLTIAPALGRVVAMPKLATERPDQRQAAIEVARVIGGG